MFTVCPKCALTLAVTAADLRVAQGYVRCGRCLNVFNALARLSEDRPGAAPPPADTATAEPAEHATPPQPSEPPSASDETGEIEVELDASVLVTSARAPAVPEGTPEPEAQPEGLEPSRTEPVASPP